MAKSPEPTKSTEITENPVIEVENTPADNTLGENSEDPNALYPLDTLAARHRAPAWQAAALARLMGWEGGKQVTNADYQAALASLATRRMGGRTGGH